MVEPLWKIVWNILKMLNTVIPYDQAFLLLVIYPKEKKIQPHKSLYTEVHNNVIHNSQKVETIHVFIK